MDRKDARKDEGVADEASAGLSAVSPASREDAATIPNAPAHEAILDAEIERMFLRYGYVAIDVGLYWVPDTSPIRIHNDGEQIGYLFSSRELEEPLWTVNRHRDGILVLWPFDREPHERIVTATRSVSQLPKFIPRDSDGSGGEAGPKDGAKRTHGQRGPRNEASPQ